MIPFSHKMNNVSESNKVFECRIPVIDFLKMKPKTKQVTTCSDKTILNAAAALII